jgi:F-type H+-transporting ATPase subunit epsilon
MKTFSVEIITPEKHFLKEGAQFLVVPAYEGEMGILPGHIQYFVQLLRGKIRLYGNQSEIKYIIIPGGFMKVTASGVEIFAPSAETWIDAVKH